MLHDVAQSAVLEVVIPPDIISEETSSDLMVPEGGSVKLLCKARGYPKPDINWKREDGQDIISRTSSGSKSKGTFVFQPLYQISNIVRVGK